MSDHAELLERFRRGAELLAFAMTGAAGPELDFRPAPDKWSVRQIVCHLADSEMVGAVRFRQILAEDRPDLIPYDQDSWAERLDYARRKPSQVIESFRRTRGENYELLKELPAEAFERSGEHRERGTMTLADLLRIYAEHAEKHTMQIRAARAAYKESRSKAAV